MQPHYCKTFIFILKGLQFIVPWNIFLQIMARKDFETNAL